MLLGITRAAGHDLRCCMSSPRLPRDAGRGLDVRMAMTNWGQYLAFGLPAAAMMCLSWWQYELAIVMRWAPVQVACTQRATHGT